MSKDDSRLEILDQVERGHLSVEEALKRLEGDDLVGAGRAAGVRTVAWWWLAPLAAGVALTGLGGWMVVLGGWWWVGAVPVLLVGIALMTLGAVSRSGPRLELGPGWWRWDRAGGDGLTRLLPVGIIASVFRLGGHWMTLLEEGVRGGGLVVVEVGGSGVGEDVRIPLG